MKTSKLLIACLFLFKNSIIGQVNLVKNNSFEQHSNPIDCPVGGFDNISNAPPILHVVDDWYNFNSPDYFNAICNVSTSYYNVPNNLFGKSYTKTGNAYAGIVLFTPNGETKEYIYQHLSSPLKQDSVYCLSFYTARADRIPFAIKTLGAYFSVNMPTLVTNYYINAVPQIVNQTGFITDTIGWTEIQGCFTAQGGEQYITIGNFNNNANTDTLRIQSTNPLTGTGNDIAYYYIDSVSLWQNNFPTRLNEYSSGNEVKVYPNPANAVINFKFKDATEKRKIELYDAIGELVLSEEAPTQNSSLKTHHLASGIYFYSILVNGKIVNTNKIVIIK